MTDPILSTIAPLILIGIGVVIIALEALIYSFILIWFGLGLVLVGLISFYYDFNDGVWQLATASLIAIFLLLTLRTTIMRKFLKAKDTIPKEDFLNTTGIGIIENGKVNFKATYWEINSVKHEHFKEGEKVQVIRATKGVAYIEKLP